jgi:phosphatidylglycerophosphatase A
VSILRKLNIAPYDGPEGPRPALPVVIVGSGFGTGFSPFAPGTAGSLAALLIALIPGFHTPPVLGAAIAAAFIAGGYCAGRMELWRGPDPNVVTIDEVAGMWVSLLFLPHSPLYLIGAFFLFRIFDILKPWPANYFDARSGGWAIMLDDIVAGFYANCVLQILRTFL